MKRKITAVLLCVALAFTLSVNAAAQNESIDIISDTEEVISQNVVEPRIQNGSIVDNGVYRIKNVNSGKYLNVHYGVDADHTNIYQWTGDGSTEQKWRVSYNLATDAYQIYSMSSSGGKYRCVDVTRGSTPLTSGQNIKLYKPTDPTSQELQIMSIGNSQYKIVMKQNTSLCLTAYGTSNGTSAGTTSTSAGNVFISTYTGAANQKWTFEYTNSTVVVPPTGWLDSVSSTAISGWIWRSDLPNSPVKVFFNLVNNDTGDEYNFTTNANVYRSDLLNAGYGNGYHGFSYTIDWRDYLPGNYTVNVFGAEGTIYYLSGSPKTYTHTPSHGAITLYGINHSDSSARRNYYTTSVQNAISNIGVTATNGIYTGVTATQALNRMRNSMIWIVHTHGAQRSVLFNHPTEGESELTYYDMLTLDSDEFANERCVIYGTCNAGEGRDEENNMVNMTHRKGAMTVIGWEDVTGISEMNTWLEEFLVSSGNGLSIYGAIQSAWSKVNQKYNEAFYGLDEIYYVGSDTQRLIS